MLTARTEFARLKQRQTQTVNEFVVELRNYATRCNFGGDRNTRLRDQFVVEVRSERSRKLLIEKDDIDFGDAEKIALDIEPVYRESKTVLGEQSVSQLQHTTTSTKSTRS